MSSVAQQHNAVSTPLDRRARLFELAVEAVDKGCEEFDSQALLIRRPPGPMRPGLIVVQQSPDYAIALLETGRDVELGLRIIDRVLDYQLTDKTRHDYGNWRWMHDWDRANDLNGVSFMMNNLGYVWSRHRNKCDDRLRNRLQDAAALAGHALLGHRCQWAYTNIFLKNILVKFYVAQITDDRRMREIAYWDWSEWAYYTSRNGIPEYNSPTYTGTQLRCLEMILDLEAMEPGFREQVNENLELLYKELMGNYHLPSGRITGPMSRCYEPAQLPDGHDHTTGGFIYRHIGGPEPLPRTMLAHCAESNYVLPDHIAKIATEKIYPFKTYTYAPCSGEHRINYQAEQFAIGSKSGGHYGVSDVPVIVAWADDDPYRIFYARAKPINPDHFSTQDEHRVLGAFRIEKGDVEVGENIYENLKLNFVRIAADFVPPSVKHVHVQFHLGIADRSAILFEPGPIAPNTPVRWNAGAIQCVWQWHARCDDAVSAQLTQVDGRLVIDVCFDVAQCVNDFAAFAYTLSVGPQAKAPADPTALVTTKTDEDTWCVQATIDAKPMTLNIPLQNPVILTAGGPSSRLTRIRHKKECLQ